MMLSMFWMVLLGMWVGLTILTQFNFPWAHAIRRLDLFWLIPRWTLFGPNPVVVDFHLCYRTLAVDGTASDWDEIDLMGGRTLLAALWNPQKHATLGVSDMVRSVAPLYRAGQADAETLQSSVPYRCLLNHVIRTAERLRPGHPFCQFFVAETTGFCGVTPEQVLFRSPLIRLSR
jgi:hypothetical protein